MFMALCGNAALLSQSRFCVTTQAREKRELTTHQKKDTLSEGKKSRGTETRTNIAANIIYTTRN